MPKLRPIISKFGHEHSKVAFFRTLPTSQQVIFADDSDFLTCASVPYLLANYHIHPDLWADLNSSRADEFCEHVRGILGHHESDEFNFGLGLIELAQLATNYEGRAWHEHFRDVVRIVDDWKSVAG